MLLQKRKLAESEGAAQAIGASFKEANDIIGILQYEYWMACANMKMIPDQNRTSTEDWKGMVQVAGKLVKNGTNEGDVAVCMIDILDKIEGVPNDKYKHWEEWLPDK